MTDEQRLRIEGMDLLLREFNKYGDSKEFTVGEIIAISNRLYEQIVAMSEE